MALQPGDVVNFARVAWDIYYLGWTEDLKASRNYAEFGSDIRGLAHSLSILDQVINTANASLQSQGGHRALVRYDPVSLREIVGDYETTLRECRELLDDNQRYEGARNPLRNIEWNILVQPVADRLRQRILMHNSKIQLVLKPFEIDLLSRIRDDLHAIHRDITNQIFALRTQVHQLMGVLVPDLDTELSQRDTREVRLLQVPDQLAEQFRLITATESLDDGSELSFGIQELSDAFILNYNRSTVSFRGGMLVTDRRPPVDHYINLLKCVWLFEKIEICSSSQAFSPESHWPGYINKLQEDLSQQCSRFEQQELVPPPIPPQLPRAMLSIWPPKPVENLLDIITPDEMMERMLNLPLQGTQSARRQVILDRRMGSGGKRFRAVVSGERETNGERARQEKETIDFEISNTLINPLYAMLRNNILVPELLLKTDERIAKLSFNRMKDVLQFQRAVTGFKVWDHWTQNNVMVSFIIAGTRQSIVERACLQLWVPEALDTSLITASDTHSDPGPSRSPTAMSSLSGAIPIPTSPRTNRMFGSAPLSSSPDAVSSIYSPNPANSQSSASRHGSVMSSPWGFASSPPDPLDRSPGRTRTQDRQNTTSTYNSHPTSPFRNSLPSHFGTQPVRPPTDRSASISSAVSLATTSNRSSSSEHTTTIATGPWSTGTLHQRPPKPMLVLFTHNESTGKKAIVTINVDSETLINPERCNCRQAGSDGFSCPIAAVERLGALSLEAYRYEAAAPQPGMGTPNGNTDVDWNLARLAVNNPASKNRSNAWQNMKRLSIMFPSPGERARFGGTPNACHCSTRKEDKLQTCLRLGHQGYLGEVKEYHRVKMNEYDQSRWQGKQHVVRGIDSPGHENVEYSSPMEQHTKRAEYSVSQSIHIQQLGPYLLRVAEELFEKAETMNFSKGAMDRLSTTLPDILKSFAIRVGSDASPHKDRHLMCIIHKNRRYIADSFSKLVGRNFEESSNKKARYSPHTAPKEIIDQRATSQVETHESEDDCSDASSDDAKPLSSLSFSHHGEAYSWLLSRLRLELRLSSVQAHSIEDIREAVQKSLRCRISRKVPLRRHKVVCKAEWDLLDFLTTQQSEYSPAEAFGRIITITGLSHDAQLLTCEQYLHQTWPTTGKQMLRFMQSLLDNNPLHQLSSRFSDSTSIVLDIQGSEFSAEIEGTSASITEAIEQLAWLAAALRTSPRSQGLVYASPVIKEVERASDKTSFQIDVAFQDIDNDYQPPLPPNGQCWHPLFISPVIIKGYPIIGKPEPHSGIEIPLNIMAALIGSQRVDVFNGQTFIKGFSKLLIPMKEDKGAIFWHLIYSEAETRLPYPSQSLSQLGRINNGTLEEARHFLGWCSDAVFNSDSAEAERLVKKLFLDRPHKGCSLAGLSVAPGALISQGPRFCLCKKDTEVSVRASGKSMRRRQQWIEKKFILLWDVADKRGWLVNGCVALLYLVKASLEINRGDSFCDGFLYKKENLFEPGKAAPKVLQNKDNRAMRLYRDDDETFDDRVDLFLNILEKLVDYQEHISGDNGADSASIPRRYLEGWDFHDMVTEIDSKQKSCMTILNAEGKSWVDFTRSISTVTLFGRGFGQLIKPKEMGGNCQNWRELPKNKSYISCCLADIQHRINRVQPCDGHVRLGRDILWHTETIISDHSACEIASGDGFCEPVQIFLPSSMAGMIPPRQKPVPDTVSGAVIFGQHSKVPWVWGDIGCPESSSFRPVSEKFSDTDSSTDSAPKYSTGSSDNEPQNQNSSTGESSLSYDPPNPLRESYTIGIICALPKELLAVRTLFDRDYPNPAAGLGDIYPYATGRIGEHLVVSACLPGGEIGTIPAADCASNMKRSFPNIKSCLLVGIAGGIPSDTNDIRLGDVVVSYPEGVLPGVVQHDRGKKHPNGGFERTGFLHAPPRSLLNAISFLRSGLQSPTQTLEKLVEKVISRVPHEDQIKYRHPGQEFDVLFEAGCVLCQAGQTCLNDDSHSKTRDPRPTTAPMIHYGVIASGNQVIKDAIYRSTMGENDGALCVEMEAAGIMNTLPTLVIRGISDYSDSRKNNRWQEYSAATAAAYARMLLDVLPKQL